MCDHRPGVLRVAERNATLAQGRKVSPGCNVLSIVDEPVAAALHYDAISSGWDEDHFRYDLGGGTFDMHGHQEISPR